jgi:hypothetical protein
MSSINGIFTNSGPQLGQFQAGALAALIGAELSVIAGATIILFIVGILLTGYPHVRDYRISESRL